MTKTEYSVECEECNLYNISPIKCENCWKKEISKIIKDVKILLPKTATKSERVLMAHVVNICKRKINQKLRIK